jgi:2-haloalkanoic acid dehalogenase type II
VTQPKAIIFDCWNTLFYVQSQPPMFRRVARFMLHTKLSYPLIKRIERSLQLAPEADSEAAARQLLRDLHLPPSAPLLKRTTQIITSAGRHHQPYHDSLAILDSLRGSYKLGMLSNTYQTSFQALRQEFKLDERFDVVMPSYEVGMIKPDPKLFGLMLKRLGTTAAETVMVGDSYRDDIQAAEAVGITGILIDRRNRYPRVSPRIKELSELEPLLHNR